MSSADRGLARNSAVMAAGSLASRLLGLIRTSMLFGVFAYSAPGQAWTVATTLPNMINLLLAGGVLNAVLVPQITKAAQQGQGGQEFVERLLTLTILLIAGVTLLALPLAPLLVRLYASGFTPATTSLAVAFALICLPAIFFYGLYTMLGQVLNARGQFAAFMWSPALCNVIWVAGIALFIRQHGTNSARSPDWTWPMIWLMAGTLTVGVAAQALVLILPLWRGGFRFRPRAGFRNAGLGTAGRVAGWTFASLALSQVSFLVVSRVLTPVAEPDPNLTGYQNAFLLFMTPHGLITVSVVTALFTRLSVAAARGDLSRLRGDVGQGLRVVAVSMIPITVATFALAGPGMRVLYPANTAAETASQATLVVAMVLGLAPLGALYLAQRTFYAFEDARTPFLLAAVNSGLVIVGTLLCLLLPSQTRALGVCLVQSLGNLVAAVVAVICVGLRLRGFAVGPVIRTVVRSLVASTPAGAAAFLVAWAISTGVPGRGGTLFALLAGVPVFVIGYVAVARRIHLVELEQVLRRLPHPIRRFLNFW